MKFKIDITSVPLVERFTLWNNEKYLTSTIIEWSKHYEKKIASIDGINASYNIIQKDLEIIDFVREMKLVLDCDTKQPIILAPDGYIVFGIYTLTKIIQEKITEVPYIRLQTMPPFVS